jgi:hypothetical protein
MKIIKTYSHFLRNEAHYRFMLLLQKLFGNYPQVADLVCSLLIELNELIDIEGLLVDAIRGSIYTEQPAETDRCIDRDIVGLNAAVNSALRHYNPAWVEAAKSLKLHLRSFRGEIEKKACEEKNRLPSKSSSPN